MNLIETVIREIIYIKNIEFVQLHIIVKKKLEEIKFIKVYYYSDLNLNLISLEYLKENEIYFKVENGIISTIKGRIIYFKACRINKIYIFNIFFIEIVDNEFK